MVQARPDRRHPELRPELGDDEAVQEAPQQVATPKHEVGVETQDGASECRLDQVALGHEHEALEPVGRPCRQRLDDQQVREQTLARLRRPAVDPGRVEQRPLVHDPGRVERVGLEVAAQAGGVPAAVDLLRVAREEVVDVALEPGAPRSLAQAQGGLRKAAAQGKLDIAAEVRGVRGRDQVGTGDHPVKERNATAEPCLLADRHAEHGDARQAARAGPQVAFEVAPDRTRDEEPSGMRVRVDGPLHRAEHARDDLPLVEQDGLAQAAQGGVGIGPDRNSLGFAIEADDGGGAAGGRGGLAGRAGPGEEDRGELGQQRVELPVDEPGEVGHARRLPLSHVD